MSFETPIVLFIYNREETTQQVFEMIKSIQPAELFVVADGAKNIEDTYSVNATRKIFQNIDWDCNLKINFSETNLGCANRIISGLNWVFTFVDKVIVLEDDCLPHPTFFRYCEELLNYYNDDEQVMHISGFNVLGKLKIENSYFFSKFILPPWGWATWKRAWNQFNVELDSWQQIKTTAFQNINQDYFKDWTDMFENIRINRTTWDVPWNIDVWRGEGLCIIPKNNLVQNIGIGEHATFTKNTNMKLNRIKSSKMEFPLIHAFTKKTEYEKEIEKEIIDAVRLNRT